MKSRRRRFGAVWCGIVAALLLPAAPVAGQGDNPAPAARMAWGDPDLQGIWNFGTLTPMERPESLADTARLTEEEAAGYLGSRAISVIRGESPICTTSTTSNPWRS